MALHSTSSLLVVAALVITAYSQATVVPSFQTFHSLGCFSDSTFARGLAHGLGASSTNTVESCLAQCLAGNFTLGGLEFGDECYCGNSLQNNQQAIAAASCNMACAGNASEICGGGDALNLYQNGNTPFTSGLAEILPSHNNWTFNGCYEDSTSARTIPHKLAIPPDLMTVELCLDGCQAATFVVGALQFGQECWCGNVTIPPGPGVESEACNEPCADDANEICGAGGLNLVYVLPGAVPVTSCTFTCPPTIPADEFDPNQTPLQLSQVTQGPDEFFCKYESDEGGRECEYNSISGALVSAIGAMCPSIPPCT